MNKIRKHFIDHRYSFIVITNVFFILAERAMNAIVKIKSFLKSENMDDQRNSISESRKI